MAATVILAKCGANGKTFGIRVEQRGTSGESSRGSDWVSTWAFPIDDNKAKREGFDRNKITGAFRPVDNYPGCPHCGSYELVQCGCGKMFCYKEGRTGGKSETKQELKCPWCGVVIREFKTVEAFTVKSGGY